MGIIGYTLSTSIGRKAVFLSTIYFTGGFLITVFGLPTVLTTGAISYWIL